MGCRDDQEDTVESVQLSDELTELVEHMCVCFLCVSCKSTCSTLPGTFIRLCIHAYKICSLDLLIVYQLRLC